MTSAKLQENQHKYGRISIIKSTRVNMLFSNLLTSPGEKPFVFSGAAGQIEGVLTVPDTMSNDYIALLGHPHSLQGGSMNNKVVTTLARAFKELGIPSLRINFRGVGNSQGQFDHGIGESEDLLLLSRLWQQEHAASRLLFAGFSFGSYVTYRAACHIANELLISIAPPVHHYDYNQFKPRPSPWHIVQGEADDVVPAQLVIDFAAQMTPPLPLTLFPDTGHFFHGQLLVLKAEIIKIVTEQVLKS